MIIYYNVEVFKYKPVSFFTIDTPDSYVLHFISIID